MACRLIVNADDFGYSHGVNAAVAQLHRAGVLTSCSLMVAEPAAEEAVALAKQMPALAVGLHLTVLRGQPALAASEVPALVGSDGHFGEDPVRVGMHYFFSSRARRQVAAEIRAQFHRFVQTGLPLSHVDAHLHYQLHPAVLAAALEGACAAGCHGLRIPLDSWTLYRRIDPTDAWKQAGLAAVFALGCARIRRRARAGGLRSPGYVLGLFRTGNLDAAYLCRLVSLLPDGIHELHCHPDRDTEAGRREVAALLSPEFRRALVNRGVKLATYADLEPA